MRFVVLVVLLQSSALAVAQLSFPKILGQRNPLTVSATIPLFDSFCYRDVSRKGASGLCELTAASLGNVCLKRCFAYAERLVDCGVVGCAPSATECTHIKYKQYGSVVYWVLHWAIPVLPKFYNWWPRSSGPFRKRFAAAAGRLLLTPRLRDRRSLLHIIRRTHAKRVQIAAAIASQSKYGGAPLSDYLRLLPLPFRTMQKAGEVAVALWRLHNININLGLIARIDPTGTLDVIEAWAHQPCSKRKKGGMIRSSPNRLFGLQAALAPASAAGQALVIGNNNSSQTGRQAAFDGQANSQGADGSVTSNNVGGGDGQAVVDGSGGEAACWECDRTADQCVADNKCDASTNYECVPVYEEDYAICQNSDAQGNIRSGFCVAQQCTTSFTDAFILQSMNSTNLWLPSGYQPPPPINASVPASAIEFVSDALQYWEEAAVASLSCMVENGGCGTDLCVADATNKSMTCVSPADYGFIAAPPGITLTGTVLSSSTDTEPQACLSSCKATTGCLFAVFSQDLNCTLLANQGQVEAEPFTQVYKRL